MGEMTKYGATALLWDGTGNVTKIGNHKYYWDHSDRLTKFDRYEGTANDCVYGYIPGSWARYKRVQGGATEYYVYDGDNVVGSYTSGGALNARYLTPGLDSNLAETRSGSTYYYMADGLGSVRNVVDASETVQDTYDYYAFGNTLTASPANVTNPYRYTGREFESGSVLDTYYYRNRYYVSQLGIFMSRDAQWADPQRGWAYVYSSPLLLADPYGLGVLDGILNWLQDAWEWANNKQTSNPYDWVQSPACNTDPDMECVGDNQELDEKTREYDPELGAKNADAVQDAIGAAGTVPVVGPAFDAANVAIDIVRDNNKQAIKDVGWILVPVIGSQAAKQLKRLSKGEICILKKAGVDIHDVKGPRSGGVDIFKDKAGNLYRGPSLGDPLGMNINDYE